MLKNHEVHDEEIHFDNKTRQTLKGVVFSEQGNWWHKKTLDGRYYIINPDKVLFVKIFNEREK